MNMTEQTSNTIVLACMCPMCNGIKFQVVHNDYRCSGCGTIVYPDREELKVYPVRIDEE